MVDPAPTPVSPVTPPLPWYVMPALAFCVLIIFAVALLASIKIEGDIRTMMFQAAISLTTMALGYYFGSSAGSAKKDDMAANNAAIQANNPTVIVAQPAPGSLRATVAANPVPGSAS